MDIQTPAPSGAAEAAQTVRHRAPRGETIEQCVQRSLDDYFAQLDGSRPHALHEMVIAAAERPVIAFAMQRCAGNQSAAAELLGINRNTLRKKLQHYGLA